MVKKALQVLLASLAVLIGLYPARYFMFDRKLGLLGSKSEALLTNHLWNIGFYMHIVLGGLALLIGWAQFNATLRNRRLALHRTVGKAYVLAALLSALAGIGIGFFATGGAVAALGFISLGAIWFSTTLMAYLSVKKRQIDQHEKWMTYSYAACFAAATLRVWLPLLIVTFGDFITAYRIVAWLCWVPNIIVANFIARKLNREKLNLAQI